MNKKIGMIFLFIVIISTLAIYAETAASVNLIKEEIITTEELNSRMAEYQKSALAAGSTTPILATDVLDVLINDRLVLQGASRDGYLMSDAQVDSLISQQKTYLEEKSGQTISDAQFEIYIKQNYNMNLTQFKKAVKESTSVDNYVKNTQASVINDYSEPTDDQINDFYRKNRSQFINPELVRLSHIFMPFTTETKAAVKKEMDQVARLLRYNTYTFEELVPKYSKDADSVVKGGDIGWLAYDDETMKTTLGNSFFEAVFALDLGKPSGVIESKGGYHIVKVTTHTDPKLLSITDKINPDSTTTVKQYIRQTLTNRNKQTAYLKAIDALVGSLRDQATINIVYTGDK